MMKHGSFTHVFHPHDEKMFENASIDVIIFRYCKNSVISKKVLYNDNLLFINNSDGLITFQEQENTDNVMFKDYFDIYVGLVSGKDKIYKNSELGNIIIQNGKNKFDKYVYVEKFPCNDEKINEYLIQNKKCLIERKIKKFNEKNWFEWGAPRNINTINENIGESCIYIYNITRNEEVAFSGKVNYFGGNLLMLKPKKDNSKINKILNNIIFYLNSDEFKNNFTFSGRFRIGHRQISNSYIPNKLLQTNCSNV